MSVKDFFYNIGRKKLKQLSQFFSTLIKYKDVFSQGLARARVMAYVVNLNLINDTFNNKSLRLFRSWINIELIISYLDSDWGSPSPSSSPSR